MTKKQAPNPPSSSSEDEAASSSDDEQPINVKSDPQTLTKNNEEAESESGSGSSDDESGSGSGDDEPVPDNKKAQPSSSTPSKPASESSDGEPVPDNKKAQPSSSTPSKPASESSDGESGSESEADSESDKPMAEAPALKKALFERIWSFEDEIQLLKGFDEYQREHGPIKTSTASIGDFHALILKSLSFQVTTVQLLDKLRRLNNKHSRLSARAKNGTALKFAKPHDLNLYELSKNVWGKGREHAGRARSANAESNAMAVNRGGRSLKREWPLLKEAMAKLSNKSAAQEALELVGPEKARVLEKKLKKQKVTEMKHDLHKMSLLKESIKLVMEGVERAME